MRRNYIIVEDIIREELMLEHRLRREIRRIIFEEQQRLDESIFTAIKNAPKIWGKVKKLIKLCTIDKFKKILEAINSVKSCNPGTIAAWFLDTKIAAKLPKVAEMSKIDKFMVKKYFQIGEYYFDYKFANDFVEVKRLTALMIDTVTDIISLCVPIGTIVKSVIEAVKSILIDIFSGLRDIATIVWNALNTVIKGLVGFDLNDIKNYFKRKYDTTYWSAVSLLMKAKENLKNTTDSQLNLKMRYIACVYRKKTKCTKKEYDITARFCKDVMQVKQVKNARDSFEILKSFPWNVLTAEEEVASWFIESCKVASMSLERLQSAYRNLKPIVKNYRDEKPKGYEYNYIDANSNLTMA